MAYRFNTVKILVVEDNAAMQHLIKSVLQIFGVGTILSAKDGQEGYEIYLDENPDLIITDWMMTPIDGISLIQKIRRNSAGPNKFVPIIMMTGFSQKRRVCLARDAGTTEFLVKPFNIHDFYMRIAQIIEKPRQFVDAGEFFGPDRRRHKDRKSYQGPQRRSVDNNIHSANNGPLEVDMVEATSS